MTHISRLFLECLRPLLAPALALAVVAALMPAQHAVADDDTTAHEQRNAAHRHDYRRFSDGPRRVPLPRGRAKDRAETLGLGSLAAARQLLRGAPPAEWLGAAPATGTTRLLWPVEGGRFGRGFGFVRRTRPDLRHDGVDIAAPEGATVRAVADGIVAYSDNGIRGFGNCVLIIHDNGWVSLYAHNYRNTVQPGWRVTRGERIGFVGSTGIARGPHLHFELRHRGRPIDPARHFDGRPRGEDPRAVVSPAAFAPTAALAPPRVTSADRRASAGRFEPGSRRTALSLLRHAPPAAVLEASDGRVFRNLLWPLRGGSAPGAPGRRGRLELPAEDGTAIRASADAVVMYVGDGLPRRGKSVVLLHKNGWVTVYGDVGEVAVTAGQNVRRGEWLGFVGDEETLSFEFVEGGRGRDPRPLFVGAPS